MTQIVMSVICLRVRVARFVCEEGTLEVRILAAVTVPVNMLKMVMTRQNGSL